MNVKRSGPKTKKRYAKKTFSSDESTSSSEDNYSLASDSDASSQVAEPLAYEEVTMDSLVTGTHILAKFHGGKRGASQYRYACIVQDGPDEDGELKVTVLRCASEEGHTFRAEEASVSDIKFNQVMAILPQPQLHKVGKRFLYRYPGVVDVFEK